MIKKYVKWTATALVASCLPSLASAQDAPTLVATDTVFILNSLLFLVGGFLVFWMAAGFSMLEAGLVRSKRNYAAYKKCCTIFNGYSLYLFDRL